MGPLGGYIVNWAGALGAGAGAAGGLAQRKLNDVEPDHRYFNIDRANNIKGVVYEVFNATEGGTTMLAEDSNMSKVCNEDGSLFGPGGVFSSFTFRGTEYSLNWLNKFGQYANSFATADFLPRSQQSMFFLARNLTPTVLALGALATGDVNASAENKFKAKVTAFTSLAVMGLAMGTNALQRTYGIAGDPSGHVMMMTSLGVAMGLAGETARLANSNKAVKALIGTASLGLGAANMTMLTNTTSCWHTVEEVRNGSIWAGGVAVGGVLMGKLVEKLFA